MSDEETQNPFTKPGFISAGIVVGVIVVLAIVLTVVNLNRGDDVAPVTEPTSSPAVSPEASTAPESPESELCPAQDPAPEAALVSAPDATWSFQGTSSYPVSADFGPLSTSPDGVRSCFARSPEGALFAAANASVQATDPALIAPWADYFIASGPNRDALLNTTQSGSNTSGLRMEVAGFRVLAFDGDSARVDLAVTGAGNGQTMILSMVYDLVWEGNDWRLRVNDPLVPIDVAQVPDTSGYVFWKAGTS